MRNSLLLAAMAGLAWAAPQGYSEDTAAPLTDEAYATIQEVFGSSASEKQVDNGGYSNNAPLTADNSNVDVLVQVIKEADSQYPSDYTPDTAPLVQETKATVEVDGTFGGRGKPPSRSRPRIQLSPRSGWSSRRQDDPGTV